MDKKYLFISSLFLVSVFFLISLASAAPPVCDWRGNAVIDNVLANASHVITSYTNNSQATNGTLYSTGYYVLHVPGNDGDNVTFKICGVYVNESYRSWSCGGVGYNTLNLSINTSANGAACSYACGCSGGYCNSGVCASSAPTTTTTTTAAGGGGGGGGAAAGTTTTTTTTTAPPVQEIKVVQNISAGQSATIEINKSDDLKIQEISVEVKNNVNNVQITIKETTQPSGANLVIGSDTGSVYKYLEITKSNIQDSDITKVKIKFKVEKSWLASNNIDKNTVSLSRLVGNTWTKLPTSILSEDSTYVYFEAESPGLSIFAITGNKLAPTTTTTTTVPTTTTTPTVPQIPSIPPIYFVGLIIIIGILIFFYWMKKGAKFKKTIQP